MKEKEHLQWNKILIYVFSAAAILFTLNAIVPKYPGQVLFPLLKALVLIFLVYIYGCFFMSLFKFSKEHNDAATSFAVGLVFTTFFFFLVSFFKVLLPGVIIAFFVVPVILLVFIIKTQAEPVRKSLQSFLQRSPLEYLPLLLPFIYAALPPSFYDSLVYHLGIPNLFLLHGGFVETPQFFFANTSIYYEISLIPAVFAGDLVPRLFHFFVGAIFLLAAADFAVEVFGLKKRHVFLLLVLCMPMSVFLLSTVKNDLVGTFFIFLGIRFLLKKQWGLSALFWGYSIGTKYINGLPLAIFLVIFFIKEKQFPLIKPRSTADPSAYIPPKKIVIFALVIILTVMPMLVKNYLYAGNPFFPFLGQYFKAESWDASRYALMKADVGKMINSIRDAVKFPYTISFHQLGFGGMVGAQFLIFLPFLLVCGAPLKKKWYLFLFAILTLFCGGYFTGSLRFLYIAFVVLCFYLAWVYETLSGAAAVQGKIVKFLFYLVISLNLVTALAAQEQMYRSFQLLTGKLDIEQYKAFVFPTYPGIAYVNAHAEPGARVILAGEARNYYLKRPYLVASGIDYSILAKYLRQAENADAFVNALRKDKIAYIILNLGEFNRLQKEYQRLNAEDWQKMGVFLQQLQAKIVFRQKGIFVMGLDK